MNTRGWTLIEITIVICILFILAALLIPPIHQAQDPSSREPTPAEESRMCEIYDARIKETAHGRAMFSAVAAYLRGELK